MRLWSLHPRYLDTKGFVAVWKEAEQARRVLLGLTDGYRNHPQVFRFRQHPTPLRAINFYMWKLYQESKRRGYNFNRALIPRGIVPVTMTVTTGQLRYESEHLRRKLVERDPVYLSSNGLRALPDAHPCFTVVRGSIESWERPK